MPGLMHGCSARGKRKAFTTRNSDWDIFWTESSRTLFWEFEVCRDYGLIMELWIVLGSKFAFPKTQKGRLDKLWANWTVSLPSALVHVSLSHLLFRNEIMRACKGQGLRLDLFSKKKKENCVSCACNFLCCTWGHHLTSLKSNIISSALLTFIREPTPGTMRSLFDSAPGRGQNVSYCEVGGTWNSDKPNGIDHALSLTVHGRCCKSSFLGVHFQFVFSGWK